MTNDIFPIDTCVITLLTLEWLGALMIKHVFLQNGQVLGNCNYKLRSTLIFWSILLQLTLSEDQRLHR